jgi:hypothetical protein
MKRVHPLILILAFVFTLIGSVVFLVKNAHECEERGGVAFPQLTRAGASCVDR